MYFFFFNDTATTEIYTLSLHDALPIWRFLSGGSDSDVRSHSIWPKCRNRYDDPEGKHGEFPSIGDRKSTRLNSSHANISYAVFCLKKKTRDLATPATQAPNRIENTRPH